MVPPPSRRWTARPSTVARSASTPRRRSPVVRAAAAVVAAVAAVAVAVATEFHSLREQKTRARARVFSFNRRRSSTGLFLDRGALPAGTRAADLRTRRVGIVAALDRLGRARLGD